MNSLEKYSTTEFYFLTVTSPTINHVHSLKTDTVIPSDNVRFLYECGNSHTGFHEKHDEKLGNWRPGNK